MTKPKYINFPCDPPDACNTHGRCWTHSTCLECKEDWIDCTCGPDPLTEAEKLIYKYEHKYPDLNNLTCWRMAKKNSETIEDIKKWLHSECDKIRIIAPELRDLLFE